MPNWDRYCTACSFVGSYLDFRALDPENRSPEPDEQVCLRGRGCGMTRTKAREDSN